MLLPHIYMLYLKYINLIQIKILIRKIVQLCESFNFFKYLKKHATGFFAYQQIKLLTTFSVVTAKTFLRYQHIF